MKIFNDVKKLVTLSVFSFIIISAAPPKGTFLGVKNASSRNILAFFMDETMFPKIFEAQGWNEKASLLALALSNAAIAMADRVQLKQDIISKYKEIEAKKAELEERRSVKKGERAKLKKGSQEYKYAEKEIEDIEDQIREKEQNLETLKSGYEKAAKKEKTKEKAESWIKTGNAALQTISELVSEILPDIVLASIQKKDSSGLLFPGGKKYWKRSESSVKGAKGVVFVVFNEDPRYKGLPDFTSLLFVRNVAKDAAGKFKYNYVKYFGKGKASFEKYGYDAQGNWVKLSEKEKIYAPMSVKNDSVSYNSESREISSKLKSEEKAANQEAEELFDIEL